MCEKSAISLSYADAPPPSRQATRASTTTMTTSHLQYRANRVARLPARGQGAGMLLIVHGKHHVQFDIRSRHHIAGIVVHGTHHRVCLRFGVIDARTPGGRFRRSRGRRIGLGLLQWASALRTEGISLLVGKPTLRAIHHRRALYCCDVLIFGFHSIAAIG